jgi:ubiquinone/menaquinone biosynthesis C-methylase UbiE
MNWRGYFDNLARNEVEEHRKVGWGTKESMYGKFYPLFHEIDFTTVRDFLDVGSGNGALEEEIAINYPHVEIYGIDISEEMLKRCKAKRIQNAEFLFGSITQIPFKNTKFDVVVSIGVLQNFSGDLDKAVIGLCRVVRAGGYLYIVAMDRDCKWFKEKTKKMNPINTYYSPEDLMDRIIKRGFSIENAKSIGLLDMDSMKKSTDFILQLHETHTFFILAKRKGEEL